MRKTLLLSVLFIICINIYPVYFKHIGVQDGLSQISVLSIHQDELGRMWFATLEGISMFDGRRIHTFRPSDQTGNHVIGNETHFLTGDNDGNIYAMSDDMLIMYDAKRQRFMRLKEAGVHGLDFDKGKIWVGVRDTLYTVGPDKQLIYYTDLDNPELRIQKILFDSENNLWIGTSSGLLLKKENGRPEEVLPSEDIVAIFEDSRRTIWVGTRYNGMYTKESGGRFVYRAHDPDNSNSISSNQVRCFAEDDYKNIWIGTFMGLNKYNPVTKQYTVYKKDLLPGSLSHSSIFSLCKDHQGSIWVGTYYGGVNFFNPEKDIFTVYADNPMRDDCLNFPFVGHMTEDKDQNIWICTEGGGLNFLDRKTRKFTHYPVSGNKNSIAHNNLKCICYNPQRNELYIGTHTGGLSIFYISKKQFRNPLYENKLLQEIGGDIVTDVEVYKEKYLILLSSKGFIKYDLESEAFSPIFDGSTPYYSSFIIDSDDFLWTSSGSSLFKIDMNGKVQDERFHLGEQETEKLSFITRIFEDRDRRLFVGTRGAGLYLFDKTKKIFRKILDGYCYDIAQSLQGYLIVSNNEGIAFIDPELNKSRMIELGSALPLSGLNWGCGLLACDNGEIFVGGIDGAVSFFEQDIFSSAKDYRLYFSDLYINNEWVRPDDKHNVLKEALPYAGQIELRHYQNNLIFAFTSNNYINTLTKTLYEYKLEGFDERWITAGSNVISYTNLNPGKYILIVCEKDPGSYRIPKIIQLKIVIHPPFYATSWAYLFYFILIISIIYGYYHFKKSRLLLQTSLELERKEKEKIEEINNAKLQFFSNISHEFRTPLTLIISQLDLLLQRTSLSPFIYNKLLKVYKNTYLLQNLINELLDFRKLEQGHIKLKVYEQDIISFLKEVYLSFYEYALGLSVTYNFVAPQGSLKCWFDPKQMRKVFSNLLSNAFKCTKEKATIEVIIDDAGDEIRIKVIDNGFGIDKEHIDKIFDRFYQVEDNVVNPAYSSGTGIGLSLVKDIIRMHHGVIRVESKSGYGSIFVVRLLKGYDHFDENEIVTGMSEDTDESNSTKTFRYILPENQDESGASDFLPDASPEYENATYKVLLVEDNEEILRTLKDLFAIQYKVFLARNGKEGFELAKKEIPDIVVSDVTMPEMSGIEMCIKLKNEFETSHIPVVLLTAYTSVELNLESLHRGADDYINKPFNAKILLARCNNLIWNRIILQKKFGRQKDFNTQELAVNPVDQKFLDSVNQVIKENMDNEAFDIDSMAKELGVSRSSFYAKFKSLTGITPNEYVLNCKLKKAAILLVDSPGLPIADVADCLGFGSHRYFTYCFKIQYGVSPAAYRRKNRRPKT
ncbi:MAG: response regulator [Tannerella sp.]|jgi:signal transduction histidine kinase/ligand-binding sensor domain-containing protein/DNA-binding response OmpR family regulator|nr:response regulator [Tannerella sp.]